MEMKRLRKYEAKIYADFTNHVIISEQDRDRLPLPYQRSVQVLSNGVDLEYFKPGMQDEKEYDVIFVGNLGYMPNIEAAEYLVKKVMPLVWRQKPGVTVCFAGARPHARILRLASSLVQIAGWVEDVRPYYAKGRIFVAPMFSGMGQQNKILEAMAMGLPCVTTQLVDKSIGAGVEDALIVAEEPSGFAKAILNLLNDPALASRYGTVARVFTSCHYSWDMKNFMLETLFNGQSTQAKTEPMTV
jgi:glycosyltransferase involved in cell wall biosynthesis